MLKRLVQCVSVSAFALNSRIVTFSTSVFFILAILLAGSVCKADEDRQYDAVLFFTSRSWESISLSREGYSSGLKRDQYFQDKRASFRFWIKAIKEKYPSLKSESFILKFLDSELELSDFQEFKTLEELDAALINAQKGGGYFYRWQDALKIIKNQKKLNRILVFVLENSIDARKFENIQPIFDSLELFKLVVFTTEVSFTASSQENWFQTLIDSLNISLEIFDPKLISNDWSHQKIRDIYSSDKRTILFLTRENNDLIQSNQSLKSQNMILEQKYAPSSQIVIPDLKKDSLYVTKNIYLDTLLIGILSIYPPRGQNEKDCFVFKFKPLSNRQYSGDLRIKFDLFGNFLQFIEFDTLATIAENSITNGEETKLLLTSENTWTMYFRYKDNFDYADVEVRISIYETLDKGYSEKFQFLISFNKDQLVMIEKYIFPIFLILLGSVCTFVVHFLHERFKKANSKAENKKIEIILP